EPQLAGVALLERGDAGGDLLQHRRRIAQAQQPERRDQVLQDAHVSPSPRGAAASEPATQATAKATPETTAAAEATATQAAESARPPAAETTATAHAATQPHEQREQEAKHAGADGDAQHLRDQPDDAAGDTPAGERAQRAPHHRAQDAAAEQHRQEQTPQPPAPPVRRWQRLAIDDLHHARQAGADAAEQVLLAEQRRDGLVDDAFGDGIGHHALQAVTRLDAHGAVLQRHQQDGAIVDALA